MRKVYIHTNNKQLLGAILAQYAINKHTNIPIDTEITNVDNLDIFEKFAGKQYLRSGKLIKYNPNNLQSFTLSRFMPPQLMGYSGKAVIIDPDVFALANINELFSFDMHGNAIACCKSKNV